MRIPSSEHVALATWDFAEDLAATWSDTGEGIFPGYAVWKNSLT